MGNEVVSCCTQSTNDANNDSDASNPSLQEEAKLLHEVDELKSTKYDEMESMDIEYFHINKVQTINVKPLKKRKSAFERYKTNKSRRLRHNKSLIALELELAETESDLKQQKHAIKLLTKQNQYLRQQNEKFLLQYGSYFAKNTQPNITNSKSNSNSNSITSIERHTHSLSSTETSVELSTTNINTVSNMSPLTPLTNKQTKIILSYSNDCNNYNNAFPDTYTHKVRSCSVPVFNEEIHANINHRKT